MPNNRLKPPLDRHAAIYAGILTAGFTLHLDGDGIRIEPADKVTPPLRAHVKRHEAGLLAHLRTLPKPSWSDVGSESG